MNQKLTKYWIGNRRVTTDEAEHYREEFGESWLGIKRKEHAILQGMAAETTAGNFSGFSQLRLIAFQTLIDFEDRYGEDWPPLKSGVDAMIEKASAGDFAGAFRLLQETQRHLEFESRLTTETCCNLPG
jgi:hypothetical protein